MHSDPQISFHAIAPFNSSRGDRIQRVSQVNGACDSATIGSLSAASCTGQFIRAEVSDNTAENLAREQPPHSTNRIGDAKETVANESHSMGCDLLLSCTTGLCGVTVFFVLAIQQSGAIGRQRSNQRACGLSRRSGVVKEAACGAIRH
jgi:hypothetical protein